MAKFLITGGAGYIGSHVSRWLLSKGHEVVILDNLSKGHFQAVGQASFIEGNICEKDLVISILKYYRIDCVMHFAAYSLVGESVSQPLQYYKNNFLGTLQLLEAMRQGAVNRFVFSSTAAVYGEPETIPIPESARLHPINPYGRAKAFVEMMLADCEKAYGLQYTSLRYFNAAGAGESGEIGEDHSPETHLIPLVLQAALKKRPSIKIFGTDYPTPDGTCLRDYIHVNDLSMAHLLAAQQLLDGHGSTVYNLGSENGYSVREIINLSRKVTGMDIPAEETKRRSGDPAILIASSEKIKRELGWKPIYDDPERIIATAWKWHRNHPNGYGDNRSS